jgi:UDP-N-acetylmuramoyl-L-alanyl-D-glutamate--2,6-diaminopimelate ligase
MDVSLQYYSDMFSFTCDLMGLFNVYNMTAAVSASHILTNKPLQEICDVLENFAGVKGRCKSLIIIHLSL